MFQMGVNIGGVQEALGRVWALCRVFTYSEQSPPSAIPTDTALNVRRSHPYTCDRRRQFRFRRGQILKLSGQIRLNRPRCATQHNWHEHPALLRASMAKLGEYVLPVWIIQRVAIRMGCMASCTDESLFQRPP